MVLSIIFIYNFPVGQILKNNTIFPIFTIGFAGKIIAIMRRFMKNCNSC